MTDSRENVSDLVRVACLQLSGSEDVAASLAQAQALLEQAVRQGAQFVLTPEVSNFISGDNSAILRLARTEEETEFLSAFRQAARDHGLWILIGSLLVRDSSHRDSGADKVQNRSFLLDDTGAIVARYDKIHLFEAHLKEDRVYREADWMHGGALAKVVKTPWAHLGLSICYDLRFPHLYRALARAGAEWLAVPSAFTQATGVAHWHTLLRARAIENGSFVLAPAQCGVHRSQRESKQGKLRRTYGHSLIVAPSGEILREADGETPTCLVADISLNAVAEARKRIPSLNHNPAFTLEA